MDLEKIENIDVSELSNPTVIESLVESLTTNAIKLIIGIIIISIGFKIIKVIVQRFINFLEKRKVDVTVRRFLKSLLSWILKILLVLGVVAIYWDIELAGFTAIIASAGVAIGLALQGSLSNFAGGFIILLLRPFKAGDYIQTSGYEGTVDEIGVFYTHLSTADNKQVLIPNGTLSNGSLINYSSKSTRRVDLVFKVGYDSDIRQVRSILEEIVDKHELIIANPKPFIGIVENGANSIDFGVKVWCKNSDYWTIHFDLLEQVRLKFDEEKISIPYLLNGYLFK